MTKDVRLRYRTFRAAPVRPYVPSESGEWKPETGLLNLPENNTRTYTVYHASFGTLGTFPYHLFDAAYITPGIKWFQIEGAD